MASGTVANHWIFLAGMPAWRAAWAVVRPQFANRDELAAYFCGAYTDHDVAFGFVGAQFQHVTQNSDAPSFDLAQQVERGQGGLG